MARPSPASDAAQLTLFEEPAPAAEGPVLPRAPAIEPAAASAPATFRHPQATREIRLDGHFVAYVLRRVRRRSIGFIVGHEGLSVNAPKWVGLGDIESALREKARWILAKLREQHERQRRLAQARIDWRDGTGVPFLGELVIVVLDPRATGAVLKAAADTLPGVPRLTLHVGLPHTASPEQIRDAVQSWLQR
ncbi:MAG TPA: YgjP-like metallopeptidase domain-containing protein, partial [Albitalea sp.]